MVTTHERMVVRGVRRPNDQYGNVSSVKGVPRKLTAFVGRLHIDTSAEALKSFLTDAGLHDVTCIKLKPPSGRNFKTAAFMVSADANDRELFYNENTWPEDCELRDWYFKPKVNTFINGPSG